MNGFSRVGLIAVFLLFTPPLFFAPVESATEQTGAQHRVVEEGQLSHSTLEPQIAFPGEFDLEACEQDCRSKFGVDPYFLGGGSGIDTSVWRLFTICIQDCNRAYWEDYDRRMKKLGDPEKKEE